MRHIERGGGASIEITVIISRHTVNDFKFVYCRNKILPYILYFLSTVTVHSFDFVLLHFKQLLNPFCLWVLSFNLYLLMMSFACEKHCTQT